MNVLATRVTEIFDLNGKPQKGRIPIFKLNNYVVQLHTFTSVLARFGSRKIFSLLNDSSHDAHFSTRQNMQPENFFEKKIQFFSSRVFQIFDSKHGSPENYSDFFFKLNNYVVQFITFTSWLS